MSEDNPNAFKNFINADVVKKIALGISESYSSFDKKNFLKLTKELPPLELKQRVLLIAKNLKEYLPESYPESLSILLKAMKKADLKGFELWPFSEYISQFGVEHFDESMSGMYQLTQRFTSEWAIRPFFVKDHKRVLKQFLQWTSDESYHVRRWVSEGSRPLLPWGQKLNLFIKEPHHTLALLHKLKFDEELYVRKSVANHLNDISKHHPDVVIKTLSQWQKEAGKDHQEKIDWITRHALRTLIKKGHPGALKLMGVKGNAQVKISAIALNKKSYKLNDVLEFSFTLESSSKSEQKIIIDYGIDFQKANGKKGLKMFKLKTISLKANEKIVVNKRHSLKPITTMKYYSGIHHLSIQINGQVLKKTDWNFKA